jgi:hypothetical protein
LVAEREASLGDADSAIELLAGCSRSLALVKSAPRRQVAQAPASSNTSSSRAAAAASKLPAGAVAREGHAELPGPWMPPGDRT